MVIIYCLSFGLIASAQQVNDSFNLPVKNQLAYINTVAAKISRLDQKLVASTDRSLKQLQKQERKLYQKLYRKDSVAARQFLQQSHKTQKQLHDKVDGLQNNISKPLKEYLPQFDTIKTSFAFLAKNFNGNAALADKLGESQKILQQFETRMQLANEIKRQLKERKQQLTAQFEKLGMLKELKKINKTMFYYQQQLKEYKALIADRDKLERKTIALLRKTAAFKNFMKQHSMLAQLFKLPEGYGDAASIAGLQTRASVEALLAQRFAGAGVDPRQYMQQQVQQAQTDMSMLQKRLNHLSQKTATGSGEIDMPQGFKSNTQKAKSFLKRLEYGANFQTQKLNGYFPVTTDIALTIGYKLNDKSSIGIGSSYKLGWGSGIQHIRLSSEGIGLRSYVDWKLKGSIWITGGYEQNYLQRFNDFNQLTNISTWRQSALLGLTKKLKTGRKKETRVQLLFDFFYKKDNIHTQPLMFRVGWGR